MAEAAIGLGSNLGDKAGNIGRAVQLLAAAPGIELRAKSRLYRTEPWGDSAQDWFLNACILIGTHRQPAEILAECLQVEESLGRIRDRSRRYGPRTIDLDLLFYDDLVVDKAGLTLPHPRLFERAFVLVPLAEIAPEAQVPGHGRVADLVKSVDTSLLVRIPIETTDRHR